MQVVQVERRDAEALVHVRGQHVGPGNALEPPQQPAHLVVLAPEDAPGVERLLEPDGQRGANGLHEPSSPSSRTSMLVI